MMEMVCCLGKILYYVGLIFYLVCDFLFDWWNFFCLYVDKEDFKVDSVLFFFSFFVGLIIYICMLMVYGYYIKFYLDCFFDGYFECFCKDYFCFNRLELWFLVVELVFKDDI